MAWNTTVNTSLLTTYLIRKFIPALENELQFQKFTTDASIPQGMGNVARFNVFSSPTGNTSSLTEGTTTGNEITTFTTTGTDATIAEYGEFLVTTRLQEYAEVPGSRSELSDRMAYGAALALDTLVRAQADSTTIDFYASAAQTGGVVTAAVTTPLSASAVIGAAKVLRDSSARGFANVNGHPDRHFAAIVTPWSELNMVTETTTGRMTWAEAVTDVPGSLGQAKWVNGFMGSVYGTACYRTQNFSLATIATISNDENYVLAEGGIGSVSLFDADPQIYINTASSSDVGNPYRNRNTIAWHAYFATALIDSNRVVKLYAAAT